MEDESEEVMESEEHAVLVHRPSRHERHSLRRSSDKLGDKLLKYWPLILSAGGIIGVKVIGPGADVATINARLDRIDKDMIADYTRDTLSITERSENRQATENTVTALGRVLCADAKTAEKAVQAGVPCPELLQGHNWPLFRKLVMGGKVLQLSPGVVASMAGK